MLNSTNAKKERKKLKYFSHEVKFYLHIITWKSNSERWLWNILTPRGDQTFNQWEIENHMQKYHDYFTLSCHKILKINALFCVNWSAVNFGTSEILLQSIHLRVHLVKRDVFSVKTDRHLFAACCVNFPLLV